MATNLQAQIQNCANLLFSARTAGVAIPPVRDHLPPLDIAAAYSVQRLNIDRRLSSGRRVVGRKIGLTSAAVQKQLGVDQPDFGVLLDDMAFHGDDVTIPLKGMISPRIEAELAFVLKAPITRKGVSRDELEAAIGSVAASAEIVDSAILDWNINIVDTVADNASSCAFALGSPLPYASRMDLPSRLMKLSSDGDVISSGSGAATLGHPLTALAWLADTAVAVGDPLQAGDIILAGALGPMKPFAPGSYVIEIDGFPKLTVRTAS